MYGEQGYGELSPIGVSAAFGLLSSYGAACISSGTNKSAMRGKDSGMISSPTSRHLIGFDMSTVDDSLHACIPERLLKFSYQQGVVVTFTAGIENSYLFYSCNLTSLLSIYMVLMSGVPIELD